MLLEASAGAPVISTTDATFSSLVVATSALRFLPRRIRPPSTTFIAKSEQMMASTVDFPEPPDLAPNSQYPPEPAAHYSQPAYSFNRTSANYPVEQDMSAVDNFNRSMPGSMDSMPSSTNGHPHPHNVATSPSNQPEMAPPQSAHQQQFPSPTIAQRPSIDDSQDLSGGMDSSKRKRSKVSRACDECRRKKV